MTYDPVDTDADGTVEAPVHNPSVSTDDLGTNSDIDGNNHSVSALVGAGFHVALSIGQNMAWRDPRNFTDDDGAAQACVDWLENNTRGGIVHVPSMSPDGDQTEITSQVASSTGSSVPVGFHIHSAFSQQDVDGELLVSITNGNTAFKTAGDADAQQAGNGDHQITIPFVNEGGVDCQSNDCGLIEYQDAKGLLKLGNVLNAGGDICVIKGRGFNGNIIEGDLAGATTSARGIVFTDDANGGNGSDWHVGPAISMVGDYDTCLENESSGFTRMTVGGYYEGANGRANIDWNNGAGLLYITPYTYSTFSASASGAHGIFFDGTQCVICPSAVRNNDGDGIHIGPNANDYKIWPYVNTKANSGDAIAVETEGGGGDTTSIVPYENTIRGTVSYPSLPWSNLYYPDGWQKYRSGTATVSAGSTSDVQGFAGRTSTEVMADVWIEEDQPTNRVEWNWWWARPSGDSQNQLIVEEKTANESVDIGYAIYRRGTDTNLS